MDNKTRSVIKTVAIVLVVLAIVMHLRVVIIPYIDAYRFWMAATAAILLLITSK